MISQYVIDNITDVSIAKAGGFPSRSYYFSWKFLCARGISGRLLVHARSIKALLRLYQGSLEVETIEFVCVSLCVSVRIVEEMSRCWFHRAVSTLDSEGRSCQAAPFLPCLPFICIYTCTYLFLYMHTYIHISSHAVTHNNLNSPRPPPPTHRTHPLLEWNLM